MDDVNKWIEDIPHLNLLEENVRGHVLVKLDDLLLKFLEVGLLQVPCFIQHVKPTHGNCCTCQICGHDHDNCVCDNNELLKEILSIENFYIEKGKIKNEEH